MYEIFEHTADLGLRVRAADLNTLFGDAARAFFSVIVADLNDVRPKRQMAFRIEGRETDYLLVDWLNELLFTFDSQHLLLSEFDVRVGDSGLEAEARGEVIDPSRHQLEHEVKAVTYHALKVQREDSGWLAEVIVDI